MDYASNVQLIQIAQLEKNVILQFQVLVMANVFNAYQIYIAIINR